MGKVGQQATLRFSGIDTDRLSANSPLEDQARAVWMAAQQTLKVRGATHTSREGRPGLQGPLVMKQLVQALFARESRSNQETINNLTSQVLRRIGAAVCVRNPDHSRDNGNGTRGEFELPTWFIADTMPENLVAVAAYITSRHKSGDLPSVGPRGPGPAEQALLHDGHRRDWITDEELGVNREPAPVQVRHVEPAKDEPPLPGEALGLSPEQAKEVQENRHQRMKRLHQELLEQIIDLLESCKPQPLNADEVGLALPPHPDSPPGARRTSAARDGLNELVRLGLVYSRKETPEEIRLRVGDNRAPMGTRPQLYSTVSPVPARTERNVIGDAIEMRIQRGELAPANPVPTKKGEVSRQRHPEGSRLLAKRRERESRKAAAVTSPQPKQRSDPRATIGLQALLDEPEAAWKSTRRRDAKKRETVLAAMREDPTRRWRQYEIGQLIGTTNGHSVIRRVMAPLVRDGIVAFERRCFKLIPERPRSEETPTVTETQTTTALTPAPVPTPPPLPALVESREIKATFEDELLQGMTPEVRRIVELIVALQHPSSDVAELKARNAALETEVARLKRANAGLTSALHAMQDAPGGE